MENKAISGQYPGSTYKLIVAMAGLEEASSPRDGFQLQRDFRYGDKDLPVLAKGGHGRVSLHRPLWSPATSIFTMWGNSWAWTRSPSMPINSASERNGVTLLGEKAGLIPTKEWKLARFGVPWQPGRDHLHRHRPGIQ